MAAVTSVSTPKPSSTTNTAKIFDAGVVGTTSPKPTVAAVVNASHSPSAKVGVRGSSHQKPAPHKPSRPTDSSSR